MPVEELFESVRVAFAPLSLQVACRGVFALPQRGEEFVEVHGGVPFLLRCWLITSIGESPALARSRWSKKKPRLHEVCRQGFYRNLPIIRMTSTRFYFAGEL